VLFERLSCTEQPNLRYDRIRLTVCGLRNLTSVAGTGPFWTLRGVSCSGRIVEAIEIIPDLQKMAWGKAGRLAVPQKRECPITWNTSGGAGGGFRLR